MWSHPLLSESRSGEGEADTEGDADCSDDELSLEFRSGVTLGEFEEACFFDDGIMIGGVVGEVPGLVTRFLGHTSILCVRNTS